MDAERIRFLQQVPIFGGVSGNTIGFLLERVPNVAIAGGEYFFREGSRGQSTFVLEEGRVSIWRQKAGEEHLLGQLGRGACFGEVALLDFGPRSASVRADVACRAIELTARDLLSVSKRNLEQLTLIYMNLGRELSRRLRAADDRLVRARLEGSALAEAYDFGAAT